VSDTERKSSGISDAAVRKATGLTWNEWIAQLDKLGARKLSHAQIAELVYTRLQKGWWAQMVAVGYERARGMRKLHQKADGFAASVSRTFDVPLAELYDAWNDAKSRGRWLREKGFEITRATANKSMRLKWTDGDTRVEINFYEKAAGKSQVTVQHSKLASESAVQSRRKSWHSALDDLGEWLARQG
jgi:uncharacterized protein YndB with AHSA1/START domain